MKTKNELKQAYKQRTPEMGVFQIINKTNGKVWIEGSLDIPARWNRHRSELRFGSHRNKMLQDDWNKSGEENFEFTILAALEIEQEEEVDVNKELKTLTEMVLEELGLPVERKY